MIAGIYSLPCVGVDINQTKLTLASHNFGILRERGVLDGTPALISEGDFLEDETYAKVGVRFEDIGTIFNYLADVPKLVAKIANQSPRGTVFLLETYDRELYRRDVFCHLKPELVIPLREPPTDATFNPRGFYLHVYRKT